jgi:hypothetical protein
MCSRRAVSQSDDDELLLDELDPLEDESLFAEELVEADSLLEDEESLGEESLDEDEPLDVVDSDELDDELSPDRDLAVDP